MTIVSGMQRINLMSTGSDPNDGIALPRQCLLCQQKYELIVDKAAYARWQNGAYVQQAWPHLSPDQREMIISGSHPECFDKAFADM